MLRMFWREMIAPQLARRLAPRIGGMLSGDKDFVAWPAAPTTPQPIPVPHPAKMPVSQRIDWLQIFRGYEDADIGVLDAFARPGLQPKPGFITDFLGAYTRIAFLYDSVKHLDGQVLGVPVPGDFHAEAVEWIGALKTVLTARGRYVAMEWGAGWAPWLVAGAKAAQSRGITDIKLYAIEADPVHFQAIHQHFLDNGLVPSDHVVLRAAVGVAAGSVQWPDEPDAHNQWGSRPIRDASDDDLDYLNNRLDRFIDVQLLEARELILREPVWDMVHIDIQGWEGEVCRSCIDVLGERVKWVVIGVHSRVLDAELLQLFHGAGWLLEHEKPTRFAYQRERATFEAMVMADGTQIWRNPRLVSPDDLFRALRGGT